MSYCENLDSSLQQCRQRQSVRELFYAEPQLGPVLSLPPGQARLTILATSLPTFSPPGLAAMMQQYHTRQFTAHNWTLMTVRNDRQQSTVTVVKVTVETVTVDSCSGDSYRGGSSNEEYYSGDSYSGDGYSDDSYSGDSYSVYI